MSSSLDKKPFTGFPERCQDESVPSLRLAPVKMVLASRIRWQTQPQQHLPFPKCSSLINSVKYKRTCETIRSSVTVRNRVAQETPGPTYIGMMVHARAHKRELVDRLSHLGISYDLNAQLCVCALDYYQQNGTVTATLGEIVALHNYDGIKPK